ncbi:MAG TPA: DinB family protein [Gemmatimonadaceae bacterium]|nr:DinB family protein [Gemmatimonadaceae bacterium]
MRTILLTSAIAFLPALAAAQQTTSATAAPAAAPAPVANPVATAFRENAKQVGKNLMAAADDMPADKFSFKPTPAQMSFGDIVLHLAQGNDFLCGTIGGQKAPQRTKLAATDSKDVLVARLKETFAFCDQVLATVDDTKLQEQLPMFGGRTMTRAAVMTLTTADWADHYSQSAIYMRINGLLPPTAKRPGA